MSNIINVSPKFRPKAIAILFTLIIGLALALGIMQVISANAASAEGHHFTGINDIEEIEITDVMVQTVFDKEEVRPGEYFNVTIAYTNTTGSQINNVFISNTLNSGQVWSGSYSSSPVIPIGNFSSSGDHELGYTMTWQLASLSAHGNGTITFQSQAVTTTEPHYLEDPIFLGAATTIEGSGASSGQDDAVTMVIGPVLEIDKEAAPNGVLPGHILVYTLTVYNQPRLDSIAATGLIISDVLPELSEFWDASLGGGYNSDSNFVLWNREGPLDPGSSDVLTFSVRVDPEAKPGNKIINKKDEYHVRANENFVAAVEGKTKVTIQVGSLLQKNAVASRFEGGLPTAYVGELITYTLTVHNPHNFPLTGVLVTDTLPGNPEPFTYLRPAYGSPAPEIKQDGLKLVWSVDLPSWGSVTRSFVVQVPIQTFIPCNKELYKYNNTLSATHAEATFVEEDNLAKVKIEPLVLMSKVVNPNHANPGDSVTYTIKLTNDSPYLVSDIRLTDTLEGDFVYLRMVEGPDPIPGVITNTIVWDGLSVAVEEELELSFEARVSGIWLQKYYNNLDAFSPDSYIPCRINIAPVKVDSPIGINKTVEPTEVFINDNLVYEIEITNPSSSTWTLASVEDTLPNGFYQLGGGSPDGNPAIIEIPTPIDIVPESSWIGSFTAYMSTEVCDNKLPKTFKNAAGNILIHLTSPQDIWAVNAVSLAPVLVSPNVTVDLIPKRKTVLAGDVVSMTLHMVNQSPYPVTDSLVKLTLHEDLTYLSWISGPMPIDDEQVLTWDLLDLPEYSEITVVFMVQVNEGSDTGTKATTLFAEDNETCFGKLNTGTDSKGDGKIYVVDEVIVLSKKELNEQVTPSALVEYEIKLQNTDYYPYLLEIVTDTIPDGFAFFNMRIGPEPIQQGNQLIWYDVLIQGKKSVKWNMRLQASPLYGKYYNYIDGYTPETIVNEAKSDPGVQVLPLFDLAKEAGVDYIAPGGIVPYTITMVNLSDSNYYNIIITDTLPAGFSYHQTSTGYPAPESTGEGGGQPIWKNLSLRGDCKSGEIDKCTMYLVFEVKVGAGVPEGVYFNTVIGASDSGSIPGPLSDAPVTVTDSPPPPGGPYRIYLPEVYQTAK